MTGEREVEAVVEKRTSEAETDEAKKENDRGTEEKAGTGLERLTTKVKGTVHCSLYDMHMTIMQSPGLIKCPDC